MTSPSSALILVTTIAFLRNYVKALSNACDNNILAHKTLQIVIGENVDLEREPKPDEGENPAIALGKISWAD
jgi:hypothetical protein